MLLRADVAPAPTKFHSVAVFFKTNDDGGAHLEDPVPLPSNPNSNFG